MVLNAAPSGDFSPATIRSADPLVVNEHEAAAVLALLRADSPVAQHSRDIVESARTMTAALLDLGIPSVLTTLGGAGVVGGDTPHDCGTNPLDASLLWTPRR